MVSVPAGQPKIISEKSAKFPFSSAIWFTALLLVCYGPILYRMVIQWATDENMGHGFFVPIVAGYIAWQRRAELAATPAKPNGWGLAIVIFAALQAIAATLGAELFTARLAFVFAVFGVVLYLGGTAWVRILLFPLLLLFLMIPIPQILYARLTLSLQTLASRLGETLIGWMGIPVLRSGNTLELPSQTLDIVDACSGIRSLMSLTFLALVYSYFADKRVWMRWFLLAVTIPIAILANGVRVAITGWLSEINTDYTHGFYHELEGYLVFVIAMAALLATHAVVKSRGHNVPVVS